jgi:farnesyl-diphosphate farnesyltransferase
MLEQDTRAGLSPGMAFCREILPHVSRTFAITIPVLTDPLRDQVGLAYLLCRIVDTVEDRDDIEPAARASLFACLAQLGRNPAEEGARRRFQALWPDHPDPHHEMLIRRTDELLDCFAALPERPRRAIAACLDEMILGMGAFPGPRQGRTPLPACSDLTELEQYCHAVAGTVGILLSRLFAAHLDDGQWLTPERSEQGRLFGLGLQLTNILKDYERDAVRGISYIPPRWLGDHDGRPALTPAGTRALVGRALEHLDAAQKYILTLPRTRPDMRLFCLWAQHLALATLYLVASRGPGSEPAKVSRQDLALILGRAERHVEDDRGLDHLYEGYREAVILALEAL